MLTGTITVKVLHKGEKSPRLVEMTGAYWKDEAALRAHFVQHCPGCEFQGIDASSRHEDSEDPKASMAAAGNVAVATPSTFHGTGTI